MSKYRWALVVVLVLTGCVSKNLIGYEQGEIVGARQNISETASPEKLVTSFELKKDGSKDLLLVKMANEKEVKEEWTDRYSKVATYETRCRGWRGDTKPFANSISSAKTYCELDKLDFTLWHVFILGFFYDLGIPFQDYGPPVKTTELSDGSISAPNSRTYTQSNPVKVGGVRLAINGIRQSANFDDDQASFDLSKFKLPSSLKISEAKVVLSFDDKNIDVSQEFNTFAQSVVEAEESRKNQIAKEKEEKERLLFDQTCLELKHWPIFYTIVQKLNDHLYEISGTGSAIGQRAILKTKKAIYDRTGAPARIRIQHLGVQTVPLKNGFSAQYDVWEECKFESLNCPRNHPDFACPRD